jgi:pentatricopeptide repeat protein
LAGGLPQKAADLLSELKERAAKGEVHLRPSQITYNTVIKAWSNTGHGGHAAEILENMYKDYLDGNVSAKPCVQSFNTVLASFGRSKDFDAPQHAVKFFELMKSVANDETLNIRLDTYTYGSRTSK